MSIMPRPNFALMPNPTRCCDPCRVFPDAAPTSLQAALNFTPRGRVQVFDYSAGEDYIRAFVTPNRSTFDLMLDAGGVPMTCALAKVCCFHLYSVSLTVEDLFLLEIEDFFAGNSSENRPGVISVQLMLSNTADPPDPEIDDPPCATSSTVNGLAFARVYDPATQNWLGVSAEALIGVGGSVDYALIGQRFHGLERITEGPELVEDSFFLGLDLSGICAYDDVNAAGFSAATLDVEIL